MKKITPIFREDFVNVAPLVKDEDQTLHPNPYLIRTTPFWLTFDEYAGTSTVTVPANQSIRRVMSTDKSGMVDIRRLSGKATSTELLVSIYDNEYQRFLMNRSIHYNNIIGTAYDPFILPVPLIIHQTQSLVIDLHDLSGADNVFDPAFQGYRYYFDAKHEIFDKEENASRLSRPYFYTTDDDVELQVSTDVQTAYITIVNDADFYLYAINSHQEGEYKIRITNLSTGLGWQNGWINSSNFAGRARDYSRFEPMLIQRRTQLKVDFINLHTATNKVYLTLVGAHYYYPR
ncbi:MAG TPA: hypothetical protein ENF45_01260 [Bacteroidetes bacterium]|nr:hypothetical protein [Bacteroidota bacterium]